LFITHCRHGHERTNTPFKSMVGVGAATAVALVPQAAALLLLLLLLR
jgi:hypothetical protein